VRVALLTTSYPRSAGDSAGHFIETEAFELARDGHEVHVIAPGRAEGPRRVIQPGPANAHVTIWGAGGGSLFGAPGALARARQRPLRLLELVRFAPRVRRLVDSLAPLDRTVAHFLVPSAFPLALRSSGELEVVLHGSDVRLVLGLPRVAARLVVRSLLDRSARFRFVSHALRSSLAAALPDGLRDRMLAASRVELPRIEVPIGRPGARPNAEPHWVVCGRLVASKRVDRAIREAARCNVDLTVIGDGPMRGELETLARRLHPRARFVGQVPRDEALALIGSAQKLLHLSEAEGSPTVIREARALGVPVLATAVGDVPLWASEDPEIEIFRPV
jgi:glycosyltransferase involved in cell wall biosynthesis